MSAAVTPLYACAHLLRRAMHLQPDARHDQREFSPRQSASSRIKIPVSRCAVILPCPGCGRCAVGGRMERASIKEAHMAVIGKFIRDQTGFSGTIETLTCAHASIRIEPVAKPSTNAPDYRLYRGASEVGAAWMKKARNGREYLAVTLDDPAFSKPVAARLVAAAGAEYTLVWSRE
jgi:uncharacterized protein (DUF736 family)